MAGGAIQAFLYPRRVEFAETDLAGVLHFAAYFRYMEEAEHALWRSAGLTIADPADDVRFVRVSASCEYRAPLRFEETCEVRIAPVEIGARTIRYACVIARGDEVVASGAMTVAAVRARPGEPFRPVDVPARVAQALAAAGRPPGRA